MAGNDKWCSRGQHYAAPSAFGKNSTKSDGLQSSCREHTNERSKEYHHNVRREQRTGMSAEEYDAQVKEQCGQCATCQTPSTSLVADHDHATGQPRKLLCPECNKAVGLIHDNPTVAERIAKYLREFRS